MLSKAAPIVTTLAYYDSPYNTPHESTTLIAPIESVGVSTCLGAANAITDKGVLTSSILTMQSCHQARINEEWYSLVWRVRRSPFLGEVYALVSTLHSIF